MYGKNNNVHHKTWNNGNQKPAHGHMSKSAVNSENKRLDDYRLRLEKEIKDLEQRITKLKASFSDPECEKRFGFWGGSEIVDSTETSFCINFHAQFKGKVYGTYSIALHKLGPCWNLSHHNLPFSVEDIGQRIAKAQMKTIDELSSFIRCLQHEINLFVWRHEQFAEAKSLKTASFDIYPSVNSTKVMLAFRVDDSNGSDLSRAFVHLTYQPHKFLPEEPIFQFMGGDREAQAYFKEQLTTLECMPLREAILAAFPDPELEASICSPHKPHTLKPSEEMETPQLKPTTPASASRAERKHRLPSTSSKEKSDVETNIEPTPPKPNLSDGPTTSSNAPQVSRGRGRGRGRGPGRPRGSGRARRGKLN